jgi:hypothetical protein
MHKPARNANSRVTKVDGATFRLSVDELLVVQVVVVVDRDRRDNDAA